MAENRRGMPRKIPVQRETFPTRMRGTHELSKSPSLETILMSSPTENVSTHELGDDAQLLIRSLGDVRRRFGSLLAFSVVVRLASSLALAPALSAVVAMMVARKGRYSFGNADIVGLMLSPTGLALIIVVGMILFFAGMAEIAGMMILGRDSWEGKDTSFVRECWKTARLLPQLMVLALRQWIGHTVNDGYLLLEVLTPSVTQLTR